MILGLENIKIGRCALSARLLSYSCKCRPPGFEPLKLLEYVLFHDFYRGGGCAWKIWLAVPRISVRSALVICIVLSWVYQLSSCSVWIAEWSISNYVLAGYGVADFFSIYHKVICAYPKKCYKILKNIYHTFFVLKQTPFFFFLYSQSLYDLPFGVCPCISSEQSVYWLVERQVLKACRKIITFGNFRTQRECST